MLQTVLITGASGGLGEEFARIFAREGYRLVLAARNEKKLAMLREELEQTYDSGVETFLCDLSQERAGERLFSDIAARGMNIDVLVNNAGFGDFGVFSQCDAQKQYDMLQVNIVALMQLTRCCLAPMVARRQGKILNVASIAAFQPGPLMSVYYASKAFVLSLSEALSVELKKSGVSVTALCPGPTSTGFEQNAALGNSGLFRNLRVDSAKSVAEYGYRMLQKGKTVAIPGVLNRLIITASKFAPRALVRHCVYHIQKEK